MQFMTTPAQVPLSDLRCLCITRIPRKYTTSRNPYRGFKFQRRRKRPTGATKSWILLTQKEEVNLRKYNTIPQYMCEENGTSSWLPMFTMVDVFLSFCSHIVTTRYYLLKRRKVFYANTILFHSKPISYYLIKYY